VFWQVFIAREYDSVKPAEQPVLILDCGANVGYTAAYLLTRFPRATLIAVEPDPGNASMLRQNLAPFGSRVSIKETAIWSHETGLVLESTAGARAEFARQVREVERGEKAQLMATDILSLLEESGHERIGLLKVDIEGAERVLFRHSTAWMHLVDNIAVELHSDDARAVFAAAIRGHDFTVDHYGELTIATRRK
jgi:FkbM family methyltransferase